MVAAIHLSDTNFSVIQMAPVQSTSENRNVRYLNGHLSGFRMVKTSLDRFVIKNIFFLFFIKRSKLGTIRQPDKNRIQKPTTVRFSDAECTYVYLIVLLTSLVISLVHFVR
jgi:hypothetical protein